MIVAIDPGTFESAYCVMDGLEPVEFDKVQNSELLGKIRNGDFDGSSVYIEMISSYGKAVGRTVFETCVWIGRFEEAAGNAVLIPRREVKRRLGLPAGCKDSDVIAYLAQNHAPGVPNHGKGTKYNPGPFYGFKTDVWQAYALGVAAQNLQAKKSA